MRQPWAIVPIVVATLLHENGHTGVQSHFNTFRNYLLQQCKHVSIVTPFHYYRALVYPIFGLRRLIDRVSGSVSVWWYRYWHYIFLKQALRRSCDLNSSVVIYAQCPLSAKAALKIRRQGSQRVVMIAHFNVSQADEWAEKRGIPTDGWVYKGIKRLEEEVLPQVDGIVYVSQYMKQQLETRMPRLKQVRNCIIPNSCRSPTWHGACEIEADLITIGTLEPRKNQRYLLMVLAHAKQMGYRYTLTVVGDGPDRNALHQLVIDLGLEGQVVFLGNQPNAARFMMGHRVYVHGAKMESFGIVLAEAMAAQRPVLAAPVGGIPEVFDDAVEGFYWPLDNPEGGAERLVRLLENADLYKRMAQLAGERYRKAYTVERMGTDILEFMRDMREDNKVST
jgi:glycosyltransferase involved in cell wall biosynthesis